ncbi:MAG: AAA family ATPase [Burkholderiales bacterium]|nr:AAA family ATPase [Burkholderiales bacterium]
MYESYYGLKAKPFSIVPQAEFLFPSRRHSAALHLLEYGLASHAMLTLITGDIGTGKTTLIRCLLRKVGQDVTLGLVSFTHSAYGDFLRWILTAFGIDTKRRTQAEMYEAFVKFLVEQYSLGKRVVLVVDETQNLSPAGLEQLRLLSNVNVEGHELLQIIMAGQTNLRDKLLQPGLEQLVQRIAFSYHLEPLDRRETEQYIRYRLSTAGRDDSGNVFTPEAFNIVYEKSGGVPRVVNTICDSAMVYGYAQQKSTIDAAIVTEVIEDRERTGIPFLPRFAPPEPMAVQRMTEGALVTVVSGTE